MSSRPWKVLAPLTATLAARIGLSVAILAAPGYALFVAYQGFPPQQIWYEASNQSIADGAAQRGMAIAPFEKAIYSECAQKFEYKDIESCKNSIFYGGFGEIETHYYRIYFAEYLAEMLLTGLIVMLSAGILSWAAIAVTSHAVPAAKAYFSWLQGRPD